MRSVRKPGTTIRADKGYDVPRLVEFLKRRNLRAHVAAEVEGSAVDGRTKRDRGYAISLRCRGQGATQRGSTVARPSFAVMFAAYKLTRLLKLMTFEPAMASK